MTRASQAHKLQVHGHNSLDERTHQNILAIADKAWTSGVAITPVDAETGIWSPTPDAGAVYTLGRGPAGVVINASSGSITGTPTETGTFSIRVCVTDTGSGEAQSCFHFTAVVS